jgi:hypothetical protein
MFECLSVSLLQPIFATVTMVSDFAAQFVKLKAENPSFAKSLLMQKSLPNKLRRQTS